MAGLTSGRGHLLSEMQVKYVRLAALVTLTAVLGNLAASALYDVTKLASGAGPLCGSEECQADQLSQMVRLLVAGLALGVVCLFLAWLRLIPAVKDGLFRSIAVIRRSDLAEPRRALILTLSPLDLAAGQDSQWIESATALAAQVTTREQSQAVLDQICDPKGDWGGWRWQQPMRVIRRNAQKLEAVAFVLTPEAAGQYARLMEPLLRYILRPEIRIYPSPHSAEREAGLIDHSDYNQVTTALDRACKEVMREGSIGPEDICIDISSGTKAYTAAATVKTLNSAAVFSYVETRESPRVGEVTVYDASIDA